MKEKRIIYREMKIPFWHVHTVKVEISASKINRFMQKKWISNFSVILTIFDNYIINYIISTRDELLAINNLSELMSLAYHAKIYPRLNFYLHVYIEFGLNQNFSAIMQT